MVKYEDLSKPFFRKANPLGKVPGLIRQDEKPVFESSVILNYLEHKFSSEFTPSFVPENCEDRQLMDLIVRCHDLYIASPNSTQPGFAHSQGAMYLAPCETKFCSAERAMKDRSVRAKKINEIWNQLSWLNENAKPDTKYLVSNDVPTHADFTWYPTMVFMEYMLPRVFGWDEKMFVSPEDSPISRVTSWYVLIHTRTPNTNTNINTNTGIRI